MVFEQELNEFAALTRMLGKAGLKKAAGVAAKEAGKEAVHAAEKGAFRKALGTAGREAAGEIADTAKSSLKDKALSYGMGALDVLSGGADEEDDGTWSSKLANWGGTAGNIAGDIAGGVAGGVGGLGVGAVPGAIAGGMAGGFLGRKAGKMLGGIIDMFSGGNKSGAVKKLAGLIAAGAIPAAGLAMFAKNSLSDEDSEDFSDLLSSAKSNVPQRYRDDMDDAIEIADEEDDENI